MVTLIVPIYNGERYISRWLDCIFEQEDRDIQLIVVNDGSTDRTAQMLKERADEIREKVTEWIYLEQDNQGLGAAINTGFKRATGEYLMLYDVDDILLPQAIASLRKFLDCHADYGFVRGNGYYVSEGAEDTPIRAFVTAQEEKEKTEIFEDLLLAKTNNWAGSYMIRADVLEADYPDREIYPSRSGQNLQLLLPAAYKSKAGFVDAPVLKYVQRSSSSSHMESGSFQKEKSKYEGYRDIRNRLICKLCQGEEQAFWLNQVSALYLHKYVELAYAFSDKDAMREEWRALQALSVPIEFTARLQYCQLMLPCGKGVGLWLRLLRKIRLSLGIRETKKYRYG